MFEILPGNRPVSQSDSPRHRRQSTYASTFENSLLGDMTKLSSDWDHEIKCDMF